MYEQRVLILEDGDLQDYIKKAVPELMNSSIKIESVLPYMSCKGVITAAIVEIKFSINDVKE